ncbi:MAG: hypothetical protein MR266_02295 [Erysipelotrichaceae bacterium]|nr:hypothetical protein [Erysipelotrichaceae bacterium]
MLYDDDVMNNVYDYLKKANTYLQFASDKYKSDLLDGTRLVRKCQEKMDEINEELAKMNNAFNLDDSVGGMTLNIGTTLGTEEETEPLFETEFTLEMIYEYIDNADFLTDMQKENAKKDNVVICYFQLLMLLDSRTNEKIATAEDVIKRYEAEMTSQDINDPEYSPSSIGLKYQEEINKAYHDLNPDCDKTHVATIGELRECIRVNKMQKIELISAIKENSYNYVYSDSNLVEILAKAEVVGTSEYKYRLFNEEAVSSYSKIGEFQELSQMWIYLDSEEKIIFNYLYKKDPNIAFDYLDSKSMKITKIKGATDALIDFKNDGKSDFSIVSGFGTGLFNGAIETIENVMASTSNPTMTSEEYRAMYMAELLSGSFQIQEYSKSDIELMYNSGEIREDVYKVLSDKEIVTDLDISYYSGNMSSAEYEIWEETYPFYQKYIEVNDETTRQKFYSTAYNVGTGVGNYVPILIASSITSGFVSSFIPALSPVAANTIGRLAGQTIDFRQAYRQHFVQNYYNGYDTEIAAYAALLSASGEVAADVMLDSIPGVSRVTNVSPVNVVKGPKMARIIGNSGLTVLKQLTNAGIGGTTSLAVNKYVSATYLHQPIDFEGTIKELGDMLPQALMTSLIINLPGNIKTFGRDIINYNKGFDVDVQIKPDVEIKSNIDTKNLVDQNILILNDDGTIKEFNLQEVNRAFGYDLKTKMDDYMKKCGLGDYKLTIDYDTPRTNFDYDNRPLFDQEYSIGDTVSIFFGIKDNMLYARLKMPEVYEPNTSLTSIGNSSNSTIPLLNSSGDSTSDMSIIPPKIDNDNIPLYGSTANNVSTENNLSVFRNNKIYLNAILSKTVKSAKKGDTTLSLDLDKFSVKAWNEKNKRLLFQNLIPKGIVTNVPNCLKDDPYSLNCYLTNGHYSLNKSIMDSFSREAWNESNIYQYRIYEYQRDDITDNELGIPKALQANFDYLEKFYGYSSLPEDTLVTVIDNCIKANRYDIIDRIGISCLTDKINTLLADESMIKNCSNKSLILAACLENGRYDLLKYFDKKWFSEIKEAELIVLVNIIDSSSFIEKYDNELIDYLFDKIIDYISNNYNSSIPYSLQGNQYLLEKYLSEGLFKLAIKFDSSSFTENIIEKHANEIINYISINGIPYSLQGNQYLPEKCLSEGLFELAIKFDSSSSFTENIIEKYGNKIIDYISINGIPDCLSKNQYLFKKCLNSSRDDVLRLFDPSLVISSMNELIELNKSDIVSDVLKKCFGDFELNHLLLADDNMLEMFFSPKQVAMIKIGRNLNESTKIKYELAVKKQLKKGFDIEKISFENIEKMPLLITRINFSNSSEIARIGTQLFEQLLFVDNPELVIDDVEKIFLLKDIPIVGKLYLTFEKLHPNFSGYNLKNSKLSPILLSFFETGNLTGAQKVIFSDLLLSALGSNNRSLIEYINDIELGNEIFKNLQSGNIKIEELSDKEQEILKIFINHLNVLYNNSDNVRNSYADKNVLTGDLETDLSRLSILFRINRELGENIPDKIVQMFAHDAGFDTIASLREYMAKKVEEANTRNFERAREGKFTIEVGDLVKGLGNRLFDLTIFENILQNGSIAVDYLGADSNTDLTPLDTDLCKIFEIKDSIGETILNTASQGFGTVFAVLKNDGRFQETRKSNFESNHELTKDVDLRKLESFLTGSAAANHYGIRTGFASSEIDFLVCEKYLARIGFELARNGIYIPVVDYNGNLVFTPEDYTVLRNKMSGLSYYNTGSYQFSPKLVPSEEISLVQKDNREEVKTKQFAILKCFANAISRLGLNIKMAIDGDLVPGTIEIIDTGSTGRYTNKPHDADFDYMLRVDKLIRENKSEFMALSKVLNEALSDRDNTSFITGDGDFRFKGVKIPGLEERVDIDITFTDRTDRIKYSSDMSLKDRLNTIKEQDSRLYDVVINEIINAKKILKAGGCYKPRHSNAGQDGLGGVGVENWILQFGGSLEDAARSFVEVANNCSTFAEFCKKYQVWDFGENFVSKPKKENNGLEITYLHDEFVSNNMSGDGYLKMQKVLSIYLKYIDMKVSDPIKSTIDEINTWLNN